MQSWQTPREPINQILNAPTPPTVLFSPNLRWLVELEQRLLLPIAELASPEVPLAGLLVNPTTNAPARHNPCRSLKFKLVTADTLESVKLPDNAQIGFLKWSSDGEKLAFTLTQPRGLELWVLDLANCTAKQLTKPILNAAYGAPYRWLSNSALCVKTILIERPEPPVAPLVPLFPNIEENLGRKTPSRTYTNLLQNPHDEALFEYYLTSNLELISDDSGTREELLQNSLIHETLPSPDGNFILISTLHRPFSYQLPVSRFPTKIQVLDRTGKLIYEVADLPLDDSRSTKFDAARIGRRGVSWRSDRPSTLYWVEAQDEGDPTVDVPYRDALWELDAPFTSTPKQLWQSQYRFLRIRWGRENIAFAWEREYDSRKLRLWRINPATPETPPHLLIERSFEDKYSDPGQPLMILGSYGRGLLHFTSDGNGVYFSGRGASADGVYPFLSRLDLETGETQRLWQCQNPYFESIVEVLDNDTLITRRQSQTEPPNYFLHTNTDKKAIPLTNYPDPAPEFAGLQKELVRYQRSDGVQLSATLYLPLGYDAKSDGALPMLFWVYPEEFKDPEFAGQVTKPENTFSRPSRDSVLFLLTQGYAILGGPTLPIIGEGDAEPNDTYVEQLIQGATAAVDYVVNRGIADRQKLGIGGHSYGAFTTVNLLAHTDLFRMGIARSGAYNRTLTPFGFQGEQRNYWEAADTYNHMSPFTHLSKVKAPLLLIHGENDSNPGTYPLQTERLYEALKGLGATVRSVMLPLEDHGYRSREAVGHVLWEMLNWCDRYLIE
ncbi:MAG: prolyl oligopeptidase family serine peptidase [Cyanomargarita calcarea GSE-NOS-MK-12-04C]|jgi:dipeptidyl aminopeptidase/acylaminoacyl peptidase|uniref:Prolyl oligopeptidase family serine peptidase n=1 Tax=Cyanomargarita calcarea GSE-NOS-MK-12-04C TaxID=2839659 RepID=A0A951QMB0_9CYAN|nr:prolyl oligopeptidase family serine peptidase [Cyanomargarita calcarea GSE-NOS-MK-12-04C]